VKVRANAKLNLSLDITGRRDDSYHLLDSVMQSITLSDTLDIDITNDGRIEIVSDSKEIPLDETNLIYIAAKAFFESTKIENNGLRVSVEKNIPMFAGLGGGSANAAATLLALKKLYGLDMSEEELFKIALAVGTDVLFCLKGATARVRGIGELILPLSDLPDCHFVIVMPGKGMSTKAAYDLFDSVSTFSTFIRPSTELLIKAIEGHDIINAASYFCNVFETAGISSISEEPLKLLKKHGAIGASLSGSGSAVFGVFTSEDNALDCINHIGKHFNCWLARPTRNGVEFI